MDVIYIYKWVYKWPAFHFCDNSHIKSGCPLDYMKEEILM